MPKTCFVIMGFGKKTDYTTGRVLDLDKSYRGIIKPAAKDAGLECVRADEIVHSGTIDVPMYEQLLKADVVIADVSTYNCNAFYELGIRHALRPYTTITIAEDKMVYPFDMSHLAVRKYSHLGNGIDFEEVERMKGELTKAIQIIAANPKDDSPVYTFLKELQPPVLGKGAVAVGQGMGSGTATAVAFSSTGGSTLETEVRSAQIDGKGSTASDSTMSLLMAQAETAIAKDDFNTARSLLLVVKSMAPSDPYVTQKLALATYKSKQPTAQQALEDAKELLGTLHPKVSIDAETLGLWGAVHKRLWELTRERSNLDIAIFSYEKGFYLKNDYYNGINFAYLLNVRATLLEPAEAIADFVSAQRTRRRVISICEAWLESKRTAEGNRQSFAAEKYWVLATLAEAYVGLGDEQEAQKYLAQAAQGDPPPAGWMITSTGDQLANLRKLLDLPALTKLK